MPHKEQHRGGRTGWLRAAVLGANDGLISTASLVVGIAASEATVGSVQLAALAGMVAGALSMAAGEYVSVASQSDTESADLARERQELATDPAHELDELESIYVARGLSPELAADVARQLTAGDALAAHGRDELGITDVSRARPLQAAAASAAAFAVGAFLPTLLSFTMPLPQLAGAVLVTTFGSLLVLGAVAASLGGASILRGAVRVAFWGLVAMGATMLVGRWFGAPIA